MFDVAYQAKISAAFVERQVNLTKRYWGWELVWLVYGVVNTLAITFIGEAIGQGAPGGPARVIFFLMIGTLVWAYLSSVFENIGLVIGWERWEGTIEHTLMAPISRITHLLGMCAFAILYGLLRTAIIFAIALLFFDIEATGANFLGATILLLVGSISLGGFAIAVGILPLLYPERGEQMALMVQATLLLVSGVYYEIEVLPAWMQAIAKVSPITYILDGMRDALLDGAPMANLLPTLGALMAFGAFMVPLSLWLFDQAELYAKRTGKLKRSG